MKVKIGDYIMSDFGLGLLGVELGEAQVQTKTVDILGMNGSLDLSEAVTGYPLYKNAAHKLTFDFKDGNYDTWVAKSSELKGKIHGKRLSVVLGNDRYYYDARVSVDTSKINQHYSQIVITLDAKPYKLAIRSSVEDWIWDTFNFEADVIRDYRDINVPGNIVIIGDVMPAGCVFDCSDEGVTVTYEGISCVLPKGKSTVPDILITEGEHVMAFTGSGTVSVEYRGGRF